jgi:hypothetical protein
MVYGHRLRYIAGVVSDLYARAHWLQRLHSRWFGLSDEQFYAIHYAGMAIFKIGIFLFDLAPFVALCLVR